MRARLGVFSNDDCHNFYLQSAFCRIDYWAPT